MKDSPDPPPAPDPQRSAQAQTAANIASAIANARLNRVNQTTPWGSINYTQGPVDENGIPTYSSEIKLDPTQQALLDEQRRQGIQRSQLASQYLGQVSGKPLDLGNLPGLYDRYGDFQTKPAIQGEPAKQQPQAPQMSRDDMMALLEQFLAQQGGISNPSGNPLARNGGLAAAVRGDTPPAPIPTPAAGAQRPSGPVRSLGNGALSIQGDIPAGGLTIGDPGSTWKDIFPQGDAFGAEGPGKPIYDNTASEQPDASRAVSGYSGMNQQVNIDGQPYYRVGNLPRTADYFKSTDPSKFKYDPKYGVVTTPDNLTGGSHESFYDKYAPYIMMAIAGGGIAAESAGLIGGGTEGAAAGAGSGVAVPPPMEAIPQGAYTPIYGEAGAVPVSAGAPVADLSTGATGGAPVSDLSVQAARPNPLTSAYNNWADGKGIFGNRIANRAAGPLLAQIIRAMGSQGRGK